jgi:colanic acid/amylovoran biosynthesis glycosyltransferase
MRISYFINHYPKVSHSFIRREILAVERQGIEVQRIALRGWDGKLVDEEDLHERKSTQYVLQKGIGPLLLATMRLLVLNPMRFLAGLSLAIKMGWKAERSLIYHLVYLSEACLILPWIKKFGSHHIHAHFGTNSAEVVMLANALGGPSYSFTVHGPEEFDKPQALKLTEKIHRAAFVVAISSYGRGQLYRWMAHEDWHKVKIVHCGLEPAFYEIAPFQMPEKPRLVCVGRLCEQKGQLLLIEAAKGLADKDVDFELVLIGDGEMRAEIEQLLLKYDLTSRVHITGWLSSDQVREEILASRALVLPSFAEGLPVVLMEAMSLRRPVISTYVAGIPELITTNQNGLLVPSGSLTELTTAMEILLLKPLDQLAQMGDAAFTTVIAQHNVDIEAAKLIDLFQAVVTWF